MFGLMKRAERVTYCGSCKTIGALYGQRARLVLNHDMVFLAELRLGAVEWTAAHKSFNCMAMPKIHPEALRYTAAAGVVLAHFQIEDQMADSGKRRWRALRRFFSAAYRRAALDLRERGFALDELAALLGSQKDREIRAISLDDVAEPTSRATEMVFGHGVPQLASIGRRFGRLVYILDAWEDRDRDRRSGNFNALLAFPEIDGRAEILGLVDSLERDLPGHLGSRLRMNVEERMGIRLRVICAKLPRWKTAVEFARSMKERERGGFWKGAAVVASVSVLAFFAPHLIRGAESWKQCWGLTLNLMAFGGVFATVPVPPPASKKGSSGCWSGCGDGCCDSCDCCECCECGSCCDC